MNIGIPKEVTSEERRVALTPVGVYALCNDGHTVFIEAGAGAHSGFSDTDFVNVGAEVVYSIEEVYRRSDLIVKVQPPGKGESVFLNGRKMVFSFLGIGAASEKSVRSLMENQVTALAYEFSEQEDGSLPILTAMSEIAGLLLPQIAGRYLESDNDGRGIMLAGVAGIAPANVVILGAGNVGLGAARAFSRAGAHVLVMDRDVNRLRLVDHLLNKSVATSITTPLLIERAVKYADVLIGAVLIHRQRTPHIVTQAHVNEMKAGAVIIDVSIDQGGCIATSRPTTLSEPTYKLNDVIHYCVPNIPASVSRTASHALNNAVLPWVQQAARLGLEAALSRHVCLKTGLYLYNGTVTSQTLATQFDFEYKDIETLLN